MNQRRHGSLLAGMVVLGLACAQGSNPPAPNAVWKQLEPMIAPRQEVGVAELNGKIYVAGGYASDQSTSNAFDVFDPTTNRWARLEPMPVAVNHPAVVGLDNKVYVLGGYTPPINRPTDAVQVFDPATNRWTQKAPMPGARGALTAVVIQARIYAVGGVRGNPLGDLAVYDPGQDAWSTLEPMPTPRDHLGAAVIGGRLYAVGGRTRGNFTLNTLEVFDPAQNRWEARKPMPTGRSGHAVAAVGTCLYAFGGEGNNKHPKGMFAEVEVYNTTSGNWSSLPPMPTPRHGIAAAVLGSLVYLPGGATVQGFGATAVNEVFTPSGCP
jgi:N-acetylneuraminic acid mutarotase